MKPGQNHDAADIAALALAFHRSPAQHADLLRGRAPLPPGVGILLKLAGGSAPGAEQAALAHPAELKAAALFFIEQVLFRHDASHYRVLGLEPGASAEQIKEHHRLLMRVFHPDRERDPDDWKEAFATRINLAYTSLHDPEARRRYDATLKPAIRSGMAPPPGRGIVATHARPALASSALPPILLRYLPQWVLAGTALFALAIVGSVYVSNPRVPAVQAEPPEGAGPGPQELAPRFPVAKKPVAMAENRRPPAAPARLPEQSGNPPPAVPAARAEAARSVAPPLQPHPIPAQDKHSVTLAHATSQRPPLAPAALRPSRNPSRTTDARVESTRSPAPRQEAPAPKAAQLEPPAAAVAAHPVQLDPNATLAQFVSSYERGDTLAFMALFDEVAIGRAGGKSDIRREHESLFQSTDLRHIAIDNMAWAQEGDLMRGEGRYRTTLMRKGRLKLQTETGIIRIELLQRGNQALIMGLDYQPGERS